MCDKHAGVGSNARRGESKLRNKRLKTTVTEIKTKCRAPLSLVVVCLVHLSRNQ